MVVEARGSEQHKFKGCSIGGDTNNTGDRDKWGAVKQNHERIYFRCIRYDRISIYYDSASGTRERDRV